MACEGRKNYEATKVEEITGGKTIRSPTRDLIS